MRIIFFGATGKLGSVLLDSALSRNHQVTVVCREPLKLNYIYHENFKAIQGDARDLTPIESYFKDQDAVFSCLGEFKLPQQPVTLFSTFARGVVKMMEKYAINRIVVCSSASTNEERRKNASEFMKTNFYPKVAMVTLDLTNMEKILMDSSLNYTIVRPVGFTDGFLTKDYIITEESNPLNSKSTISLEDISHFFLQCLETTKYDRKAIMICDKAK